VPILSIFDDPLVPNFTDYLGVSNFQELVFEISFRWGRSVLGGFLSCGEPVEMTLLVEMVGDWFCCHFDDLLIIRRFAPQSDPISTAEQLLLNFSVASSRRLIFQFGDSRLLDLLFCFKARFDPLFDLFDTQSSEIEHFELPLMRSHVIGPELLLEVILHFLFEDPVKDVHERRAIIGVVHDLLFERVHPLV